MEWSCQSWEWQNKSSNSEKEFQKLSHHVVHRLSAVLCIELEHIHGGIPREVEAQAALGSCDGCEETIPTSIKSKRADVLVVVAVACHSFEFFLLFVGEHSVVYRTDGLNHVVKTGLHLGGCVELELALTLGDSEHSNLPVVLHVSSAQNDHGPLRNEYCWKK